MKMKTEKQKRIILDYFVPVLFFIITFCVYIPSFLFYKNIDEYSIDYIDIIPIIIMSCVVLIVLGLIIFLICKQNRKLLSFCADVIFGISLGIYIQSNFLNKNLSELNGAEVIQANNQISTIINVVVWLFCLILPHLIRKIAFNNKANLISIYAGLLLILMQLVSLSVTIFTTSRTIKSDITLTKNDEFLLSSQNNVVVFVVDTFDAQWAEKYIVNNPDYSNLLKGFTYFDNVVSQGAPTYLGMRMLFTGKVYDPHIPFSQYNKEINGNNTLFSDLQENNYRVNLYTNKSYISGSKYQYIDNFKSDIDFKINDVLKFLCDLYKLSVYNGAPDLIKNNFILYSGDLTNNFIASDPEDEPYIIDDTVFYKDFISHGIKLQDQKNQFILYHMYGPHGPHIMNENAEKVDKSETSREKVIYGVFKIIGEYIDEMKKLDIYDNCTLIITADHGALAYYQNPAVFIKNRHSNSEFKINSAPLTFSNLRATFVENIIENYKESYGPGMYDIAEDADVGLRPHTFVTTLYKRMHPNEPVPQSERLQFLIGNPARDNSLIIETLP